TPVAMVEDDDHNLFVTFSSAIARIKNGDVKELTVRDGLPQAGSCWSLARDTKGHIWLSKGNQVLIFQGGHFETVAQFNTASIQLACRRTGGIWICADRQLFTVGEDRFLKTIGAFTTGKSLVNPTTLLEDRNGGVWIGTERNGLF